MRDTLPPTSLGPNAILESGVLAFRRGDDGEPMLLPISHKRSKKWGIPKGRPECYLSLHENAAKEAFERLFLHPHVGMDVDLSGLDVLVTKPERDHRLIDAVVEQVHRRAVAQRLYTSSLTADTMVMQCSPGYLTRSASSLRGRIYADG